MANINQLNPTLPIGNTGRVNDKVDKADKNTFADVLKKNIAEVNSLQQQGEEALAGLATGQVQDLHQAAITLDKAEISMKLMLEVRNKAISAFKEISRTQM
jgi:flagellar hook-basal body complex protein FliE